jgi:predicted transcriptional regulator
MLQPSTPFIHIYGALPMAKRITTTITLSPEAQQMLTEIAQQQLRSRSHAIETLILQAYTAKQEHDQAQHKAINIQGI